MSDTTDVKLVSMVVEDTDFEVFFWITDDLTLMSGMYQDAEAAIEFMDNATGTTSEEYLDTTNVHKLH